MSVYIPDCCSCWCERLSWTQMSLDGVFLHPLCTDLLSYIHLNNDSCTIQRSFPASVECFHSVKRWSLFAAALYPECHSPLLPYILCTAWSLGCVFNCGCPTSTSSPNTPSLCFVRMPVLLYLTFQTTQHPKIESQRHRCSQLGQTAASAVETVLHTHTRGCRNMTSNQHVYSQSTHVAPLHVCIPLRYSPSADIIQSCMLHNPAWIP